MDKYTWNRWYGGPLHEHPELSPTGLPADIHNVMLPTSIPNAPTWTGLHPIDPMEYSPFVAEADAAHHDGANNVHGPSREQIGEYGRKANVQQGLVHTIREAAKAGVLKHKGGAKKKTEG